MTIKIVQRLVTDFRFSWSWSPRFSASFFPKSGSLELFFRTWHGAFLKRRVNLFERSTMLDDDNHLVAPNKVLERGWSGTCGCTTRARGSLPSLLKAVQRKYNLMERGKTDVRWSTCSCSNMSRKFQTERRKTRVNKQTSMLKNCKEDVLWIAQLLSLQIEIIYAQPRICINSEWTREPESRIFRKIFWIIMSGIYRKPTH